jgi:very-short-patch-repair endonuclease
LAAFQDDHIRDSRLARVGLDVLRFSDWQIDNQPQETVATLRARLDREERR